MAGVVDRVTMQYVRNLSDSVSTAWNSINPATLSGAIDVIVVQHEDDSLACSPFHVRFGKFSLLRPSDKKVEFKVNGIKQEYSMKLGEGGEAFFVFETTDNIPESLQTSPLVSPVSSPPFDADPSALDLQEPEPLELDLPSSQIRRPPPSVLHGPGSDFGKNTPITSFPGLYLYSADRNQGPLTTAALSVDVSKGRPASVDWSNTLFRPHSDNMLRHSARQQEWAGEGEPIVHGTPPPSDWSQSPPPLAPQEAVHRAMTLARELSAANIPSQVTESGDLMLDMTGFKSSEEDMLRAEMLARKILAEELEGDYDIGALFGFDAEGNLWIYSSEEAKQTAMKKTLASTLDHQRHMMDIDAVSDPGYQSDGSDMTTYPLIPTHRRSESDAGPPGMQTPPRTPSGSGHARDPTRNYAKTLRLTSDQLKQLKLKPGENSLSFTVNRATCSANMYLWKHETPVVISDIDGTITKSDALGHVLNMIGRDWTHSGIAKLYSDIAQNGYNIMYLTSRSVGQADTTRAYVNNVVQDGCRLPHGPTILSPDRTMAALRREVYLRKPHVFKMATLRDIRSLYGEDRTPFTAGFGNRLTDQISYRTVDVPRNRIFTINSNSEVSLDLLSLNKLKMSYVNINEVVDHYFPPVSTLIKGGGEEYTDFKYWRNEPLDLDEFSASDSDDTDLRLARGNSFVDDEDDEDVGDGMADSYISRDSTDHSTAQGKPWRKSITHLEDLDIDGRKVDRSDKNGQDGDDGDNEDEDDDDDDDGDDDGDDDDDDIDDDDEEDQEDEYEEEETEEETTDSEREQDNDGNDDYGISADGYLSEDNNDALESSTGGDQKSRHFREDVTAELITGIRGLSTEEQLAKRSAKVKGPKARPAKP